MKELAMHFVEKACNRILDFYIGYNKQMLAECLQDLTMFQTSFGTLRLVILPIYCTNSIPIFYEDMTYILKKEILKYTLSYINDVLIRGLITQYKQKDKRCL